MATDPRSPFMWRQNPEPSIFAGDVTFQPRRDGKSQSQLNSEAVTAITRRTGKSPGTLRGISRAERFQPKAYSKRSGAQ